MDAIIDKRIKKVVTIHDVLHAFSVGRRTGKAIMELKLAQDLESVDQDPLFLVFLDLRRAYDNLFCGLILKTLEGCGVGPKMRGILEDLCALKEVVTRQHGYHSPQFRVACVTIQGGMTYPTIFNVAVENMVWNWLYMIVEDAVFICDGLVHAVGRIMGVFYVYNGIIG